MVVHSDEYLADLVRDELISRGFSVNVYPDAYSAIEAGRTAQPEILIFETRPDLERDAALAHTIQRAFRSLVGTIAISSLPLADRRAIFEHALVIPFRIDDLLRRAHAIVDARARPERTSRHGLAPSSPAARRRTQTTVAHVRT